MKRLIVLIILIGVTLSVWGQPPITSMSGYYASQPASEQGLLINWHPGGTMVAYAVHGSNEVVIVDVTSNFVLNIIETSDPLFDAPQWSPDGQLLAFTDASTSIAVWSNVWDTLLASRDYYLDVISKLGRSNTPGISYYAWHPSDTQVAHSVGPSLYIWDLGTDDYRHIPRSEHISQIADLQWFDEDIILLGDSSPRVALVDVQTGEIETSLYLSAAVTLEVVSAVSPSPDRSRVAFGSTLGLLEIWDPSQGTFYEGYGLLSYESERSTLASQTRMNWVDWNATGEYIAMVDQDGLIRVWNAETLELMWEYQGLPNGSVAWSPDGTQLAFGTATDGLVIVDSTSIMPALRYDEGLLIDWHPSGTMIAYTFMYSHEVVIVDVASNVVLNTFETSDPLFDAPQWSPDGEFLTFLDTLNAIAVWSNAWDPDLAHQEYYLNRIDKLESTNLGPISGFAWHPSGTKIAHSVGPSLYIWDLMTDEYHRISIDIEMFTIKDLEWFDEDTLLFGDTAPSAVLINTNTGQFEANFIIRGTIQITSVSAIASSPDRTYIALASPFGQIEIWDPTQGEVNDMVGLMSETAVRSTFGSQSSISSLDWSSTGEYIAMVDQDGLIRVWNAETLELMWEYQGLPNGSVAWSPDGTQLAFGTATDGLVIVEGPLVIPLNQIPIANAGADQTITADAQGNALVTLDGSASTDPDGTIVSYAWTENGVEIATGATPQVTLSVGTHMITLTVTDDDGAVSTDETVFTTYVENP